MKYSGLLTVSMIISFFASTVSAASDREFPPSSEMAEVYIFDANSKFDEILRQGVRQNWSLLAPFMPVVTLKLSQMNVLTVFDVNATAVEVRAAMQSERTSAVFFGGHGSPKGRLVDGDGRFIPNDSFSGAPASSVQLIEWACCYGEKIAENYPVPPYTAIRHKQGVTFNRWEDLETFPKVLKETWTKKEVERSVANRSQTIDPYRKAYPRGDIYVLESEMELTGSRYGGSILSGRLFEALATKAASVGYRVLFYRGDKYEQIARDVILRERTAGILLNGPDILLRPSNAVIVKPIRALFDAVSEEVATQPLVTLSSSFEFGEKMKTKKRLDIFFDTFLAKVDAIHASASSLCSSIFEH